MGLQLIGIGAVPKRDRIHYHTMTIKDHLAVFLLLDGTPVQQLEATEVYQTMLPCYRAPPGERRSGSASWSRHSQ